MKNNLTTTNHNAKLALTKSKILLSTMNNLLPKKENSSLTKKFKFKPYFSDGHFDSVESLAITPDGKTIISGSSDNTIKLWNINSGMCVNTLNGHVDSVNSLVITPDGNIIISGSQDKTIKLWDIQSGECIKTFDDFDSEISSIVVTQDGNTMIASHGGIIKLWDIGSGKCIKTIEDDNNKINSIAVTNNGQYIVSGSSEIYEEYIYHGEIILNSYAEIKIWDIESGECISTVEQNTPRDSSIIALILDCDLIYSGSSDGTVKRFSLETDDYMEPLIEAYYNGHMNSLIATPDGGTLIMCNSHKTIDTLYMFRHKHKSLEGHVDSVNSLAITPDGNIIISGSQDKTIKLWDIKSGKCINTFENHMEKVSKLEDGSCIYTLNDGSTITMFLDGSFNASEENINKFIRVQDTPLSCRKLTEEEIKHFCKIKYDNFDINKDEFKQSKIPEIGIDDDEIPF